MSNLQSIMVVAESVSGIVELTSGASSLAEKTVLIFAGDKDKAINADTAYYLGDLRNESFLSYIPSIITIIKQNKPQLVLVESTKNGRLAAAVIATIVGTSVLTDASEIKVENGKVISKRMVYGGAAIKTEKGIGDIAVVCVGNGVFEADISSKAIENVIELDNGTTGIRFVEKRPKEGKTVNLAAAKCVVGVGRGFGNQENVKLARDLAETIDGEVGCSRPVAEEAKWMPVEAYLGVSGVIIKPDIYIACGISGQIQHMTGVNQAKTIVAINKDRSAPIFEKCDYGIVGDLNKVLPVLTEKFKN